MSGPKFLQDFVIALPGDVEVGYGFDIPQFSVTRLYSKACQSILGKH